MRSDTAQPIKIAIVAMGGEGGGVLADWIVDLGEANGHIAQTTSVPGVAQRTGATIYYVELFPRAAAERDGGRPVLALMPLAGDVDVVLASELMEAGRAVQRGLVTADRTTLIASTHRVFSIGEKIALGDGRVDSDDLLAHAEGAARRFVGFDMAKVAGETGSVISAVLFGALAGADVLPFDRAQFEATIGRGGVGVATSLAAFAAGHARAGAPQPTSVALRVAPPPAFPVARDARVQRLLDRIRDELPPAAQALALEGVRRLVDYQDADYAALYLDRLARIARLSGDPTVTVGLARHLALWMSYEDTVRVADLKTRDSRFARVRAEVGVRDDQVLAIGEFVHPRAQEICDTLPAALGRRLERPGLPRRLLERVTRAGRVVETTSLRGFLLLYALARTKRWRRASLRYARENARIERWLARIAAAAGADPRLAVELIGLQQLVKGYGDTHERGMRHYDAILAAVDAGGGWTTAAAVRELREAALADERGDALRAALARDRPLQAAA